MSPSVRVKAGVSEGPEWNYIGVKPPGAPGEDTGKRREPFGQLCTPSITKVPIMTTVAVGLCNESPNTMMTTEHHFCSRSSNINFNPERHKGGLLLALQAFSI